jgi:hypothetical protein
VVVAVNIIPFPAASLLPAQGQDTESGAFVLFLKIRSWAWVQLAKMGHRDRFVICQCNITVPQPRRIMKKQYNTGSPGQVICKFPQVKYSRAVMSTAYCIDSPLLEYKLGAFPIFAWMLLIHGGIWTRIARSVGNGQLIVAHDVLGLFPREWVDADPSFWQSNIFLFRFSFLDLSRAYTR